MSMSTKRSTFGDEIRQHIRNSGFYENELAAKIGIGPASMSRFMHGKAGLALATLERLADVLDLHVVKGQIKR